MGKKKTLIKKIYKPLELIKDSTLQFLFLFSNADAFYISARYNIYHGWDAPGLNNAHQAIELYIKAILKLNEKRDIGHDLLKILKKFKGEERYFAEILSNKIFFDFLSELSEAYLTFRYGEAGAKLKASPIVEILDELVYNLRDIYATNIKMRPLKLYLPNSERAWFLKGNKFFKNENLTDNFFSQRIPWNRDLPLG